jgi:hypothetical protein
MAMSETRPPITAGPIDRALRFLNRTSVNCAGPDDGAGVTEADNAGVVLAGEADGAAGDEAGGDSSWARQSVLIKKAEIAATRMLIG